MLIMARAIQKEDQQIKYLQERLKLLDITLSELAKQDRLSPKDFELLEKAFLRLTNKTKQFKLRILNREE